MAGKNKKQAVASEIVEAVPNVPGRRFRYDHESNGFKPEVGHGKTPKLFDTVRFDTDANGDVYATVPALATGMALPSIFTGAQDWQLDSIADWRTTHDHNDQKGEIREGIFWFNKDPLVFRCVRTYSQIANDKLALECDDESFQEIVNKWFQRAMPHSFRASWYTEYFRTSFVPVVKTLTEYKPKLYKQNKIPQTNNGNVEKALADDQAIQTNTERLLERNQQNHRAFKAAMDAYEQGYASHKVGLCSSERLQKLQQAMADAQYQWLKGFIPGSYTVLDPEDVTIEGPPELSWLREPFLSVSQQLRRAIEEPTPTQAKILSSLPLEIVQQIKAGNSKIWLSPNICSVITGEKLQSQRYPKPIACHARDALLQKQMMMQADLSQAKSIRDKILKVTLGTDELPCFDQTQIQELAQMFARPGRSLTLFHNHTLNIEWIEPKHINLGDENKYVHYNNEIRTAFGMSAVITGTSDKGGSTGDAMMNMKGVEIHTDEAHAAFDEFLMGEIEMLKQALGVKYEVRIIHDRKRLKDEDKYIATLLTLVQNGLLDPKTALDFCGFHYPSVVKRLEQALKMRKKGLFNPMPSSNNMGPTGGILGPTGGAPAKKPLGNKNANKVGTSQPKKAKARLVQGPGNTPRMVVTFERLTAEERQSIADRFSMPVQWIKTEAEYKKETGGREVNWLPPLPDLDPVESCAAIREATEMADAVKSQAEVRLADVKAAGGGKRGKYITEEMRAEANAEAFQIAVAAKKPEAMDADTWNKHVQYVSAEMLPRSKDLGMDVLGVNCYAAAVVARKFTKTLPAARIIRQS
jgi:hypothetical protein